MFTLTDIAQRARPLGFELMGVAPVESQGGGWFRPHVERFESWLASGKHAQMDYIARRAGERVAPELLLPGVRSALVLWMNHRTETFPRPEYLTGRVAAYAWGRDYHNIARKRMRKLLRSLREDDPTLNGYLSIDTAPVLERAFGERAAVGWIGRSTMLIHPEMGTFGTVVVLFVDQEWDASAEAHPYRCGTCTDCIDMCPTGALGPDGLDSRLCISYWTIEHRGLIPVEMRPQIGDWVFGCDVCQDVCPWNHDAPVADSDLWEPRLERAWPDLIRWLTTDPEQLNEELLGSPLRRAHMEGLRRNALIVLANGGHTEALPTIRDVFDKDPDPVVRATALWAMRTLGDESLTATALKDPEALVRAEAEA
jgi:epoxyqueuosine reductase